MPITDDSVERETQREIVEVDRLSFIRFQIQADSSKERGKKEKRGISDHPTINTHIDKQKERERRDDIIGA